MKHFISLSFCGQLDPCQNWPFEHVRPGDTPILPPLNLIILFWLNCLKRSEDERETWGFLKVMCEDDGTTRTKLLNHLGFSLSAEEVNDTVQNYTKYSNMYILMTCHTENVIGVFENYLQNVMTWSQAILYCTISS